MLIKGGTEAELANWPTHRLAKKKKTSLGLNNASLFFLCSTDGVAMWNQPARLNKLSLKDTKASDSRGESQQSQESCMSSAAADRGPSLDQPDSDGFFTREDSVKH